MKAKHVVLCRISSYAKRHSPVRIFYRALDNNKTEGNGLNLREKRIQKRKQPHTISINTFTGAANLALYDFNSLDIVYFVKG